MAIFNESRGRVHGTKVGRYLLEQVVGADSNHGRWAGIARAVAVGREKAFDILTESSPRADVAQLVEQPIRNRQVTSSSLVVGSIYLSHSSRRQDCTVRSVRGVHIEKTCVALRFCELRWLGINFDAG